MGEMSELDKWVLETAKDIDAKLCEYAENWEEAKVAVTWSTKGSAKSPESDTSQVKPNTRKWDTLLETQKVRIDLIKSIMGD